MRIRIYGINKINNISPLIHLHFCLGLYDAMPNNKILAILKRYMTQPLFRKLHKFVTGDLQVIRAHLNWTTFKDFVNTTDLNECSEELMHLLNNTLLSEDYVKTFHIAKNNEQSHITEPTIKNTYTMVKKFLTYIYQRNVLASFVKYILLKDILIPFEKSNLSTIKKGIFFLMNRRLNELVFECILTAFNCSNYDNYLITNYLIIIQTEQNQKIKIYKKGASISTIHLNIKTNINQTKFIIYINYINYI